MKAPSDDDRSNGGAVGGGDGGGDGCGVALNSIMNMSTPKFNKQLANALLLEGWGQSTHELNGRSVDNLSQGSSGDPKARIVLGFVAWANAKGKRVCQQRVRDARKVVCTSLNKLLKRSLLRL